VRKGRGQIRLPHRARWRGGDFRRTAKGPAACLLALCFLLDPFAGSLPWLQLRKAIVKNEVREHLSRGIEAESLVVLRFSREKAKSLLRWEHSGEFEYNGEMYDVVESWTAGDTVFYRCWPDREETELNSRIRTLAARALAEAARIVGPAGPRSWSSRVLFCPSTDKGNLIVPGLSLQTVRAFFDFYSSIVIPPPTPPPKRG